MPIPVYTTLEEIYAACDLEWHDNNSRDITPQRLRDVVEGIVKYFGDFQMYKPEIIPIAGQDTVVIDLNSLRMQYYGQVPQIVVFIDDGTGQFYQQNVPWFLDALPPYATTITVSFGAPADGVIILK